MSSSVFATECKSCPRQFSWDLHCPPNCGSKIVWLRLQKLRLCSAIQPFVLLTGEWLASTLLQAGLETEGFDMLLKEEVAVVVIAQTQKENPITDWIKCVLFWGFFFTSQLYSARQRETGYLWLYLNLENWWNIDEVPVSLISMLQEWL